MGLFSRKPKLESTGHEGDDQLLGLIAKRSSLDEPRHWVHYLYFPDEATARTAVGPATAAGWEVQVVDEAGSGDGTWVLILEKHDAVLSPEAVRAAREFFERLVLSGGEYDGWEASL